MRRKSRLEIELFLSNSFFPYFLSANHSDCHDLKVVQLLRRSLLQVSSKISRRRTTSAADSVEEVSFLCSIFVLFENKLPLCFSRLTSTSNCSFHCFITLGICQNEPKLTILPYFQVRARDGSLGGAWTPPTFVRPQRARSVTSLYCFIAHSPEFECRNSSQIRERGVVDCRRRTELFTTSFDGVSVSRFVSVFIILFQAMFSLFSSS